MHQYNYIGDRNTEAGIKGKSCTAVLNKSGKCIRGRNGNMLVVFDDGVKKVVVARLLRKIG
jgi:hypothetical protein